MCFRTNHIVRTFTEYEKRLLPPMKWWRALQLFATINLAVEVLVICKGSFQLQSRYPVLFIPVQQSQSLIVQFIAEATPIGAIKYRLSAFLTEAESDWIVPSINMFTIQLVLFLFLSSAALVRRAQNEFYKNDGHNPLRGLFQFEGGNIAQGKESLDSVRLTTGLYIELMLRTYTIPVFVLILGKHSKGCGHPSKQHQAVELH